MTCESGHDPQTCRHETKRGAVPADLWARCLKPAATAAAASIARTAAAPQKIRTPTVHLFAVPLELPEANELVARWHRHHQPAQGHRFSLGVIDEQGTLHGAAIVGRPVARLAGSPRDVLEVVRLVTDGTKNAPSLLYAAAARAGAAIGYRRIQTYILGSETGASLRAAGWTDEGTAGGGDWNRKGQVRRTDQPMEVKNRWAKTLGERPDLAGKPARHREAKAEALDFDWITP